MKPVTKDTNQAKQSKGEQIMGYTEKAKKLAAKLTAQGLDVLWVTDIGRTFHVTLPLCVTDAQLTSLNLGRRNLRFVEARAAEDPRTMSMVLVARFAPKL